MRNPVKRTAAVVEGLKKFNPKSKFVENFNNELRLQISFLESNKNKVNRERAL